MTTPQYRPIVKNDLPRIEAILDGINLFPSDMLEDTIAGYLENEASSESWICATIDDVVVWFGYCVQEKLTEGTYNIYALWVQQELQWQGIWSGLLTYIETSLAQQWARILI